MHVLTCRPLPLLGGRCGIFVRSSWALLAYSSSSVPLSYWGRALPLRYLGRLIATAVLHPSEILDRARGRVELRHDRRREWNLVCSDPDWWPKFHRILGGNPECDECSGFDELWGAVANELQTTFADGHDADYDFARAIWTAIRHLGPSRVVETGVARGVTTRFILEAGEQIPRFHLTSIDLPPIYDGWEGETAAFVPNRLKRNWKYIRGSSRRRLHVALDNYEQIELGVLDSLHTYETMIWEMETSWARLASKGLLIVDDIDDNSSYSDFAVSRSDATAISAPHRNRKGSFGILMKEFGEPGGGRDATPRGQDSDK